MRIPIFSITIQEKIINYLDQETSYIDKLISSKEQQLKLLIEKRQAIISNSITIGIKQNTKRKKINIEWLEEIPEHWILLQLKFLSTIPLQYGANEAALDENPENPRFVRITDIDEYGNLKEDTFKSLEPDIAAPYLLEDGDVLFARSGATVGKSFIYKDSWGISCFAGYLIRFRCNKTKLLPDYLNYFTQSNMYWAQINEGTIQATIQNFSGEKYGSMKFALPPIEEQKDIISFLNYETERIDVLRKSTEESIALLKERREALITAAVTGQINIT